MTYRIPLLLLLLLLLLPLAAGRRPPEAASASSFRSACELEVTRVRCTCTCRRVSDLAPGGVPGPIVNGRTMWQFVFRDLSLPTIV